MKEESLISEEVKAWVGKEVTIHTGEITKTDIQRYALTVDDYNPLYLDEDYAKSSRYGTLIAPPNFLSAVRVWQAGPSNLELNKDGTPKRQLLPPFKALRKMGGGQELEFYQPVRPGDSFTVTQKLIDVYEKEGKKGKLVFAIIESTYTNQLGRLTHRCRDTIIIRF